MQFSELANIMEESGINTLADIARALDATPQAVSNWKARDQVPFHVVAKVNESYARKNMQSIKDSKDYLTVAPKDTILLSDILLILAEQFKVILITIFTVAFISFTYFQFIQESKYTSSASIILQEKKTGNLGGLAGLATQFGVEVPSISQTDLASPDLFPELIKSRVFGEKILNKNFLITKYDKQLSLLSILTHGDEPTSLGIDTLITHALSKIGEIITLEQDLKNNFSVIKVTTFDPQFSKNLADAVLIELEELNKSFKIKKLTEKTKFIEKRILSVEKDLEYSEQKLKEFSERNRQVSSPALQLSLDRIEREVEIQKGIFLTLKQQLELAKIEEVQQASILQVLDSPKKPIYPSNKKSLLNIILTSIFGGFGLGALFAFIRSYINNNNIDERRKLRKVKNYVKKKGKDIILDQRIAGIIGCLLIFGLPFYLGHESQTPVFFGRYSLFLMIFNSIYIIILIISIFTFFFLRNKKTN